MISIEEMEIMLEELAGDIPNDLYKDLNGGIILLPETKLNKNHNTNDLYILGEYHFSSNMGRYIAIYYGSFSCVYKHLSKDNYKKEIDKILKHEFRHHLESLAGERGLEIEDAIYIANYLKRHGLQQ